MKTYIALLRGINVGGANKLPMRELVTILETLGLQNIKTYIQSGNVVFQSEAIKEISAPDLAKLADSISEAINDSHSFKPRVLLLAAAELKKMIAANPFPEGEAEPKTLHLYFLAAKPETPDLKTLETLKRESERFTLQEGVFYLHAPDGIGRSKLAARIEKSLGVAVTARNWRTVCKVMALAEEYG